MNDTIIDLMNEKECLLNESFMTVSTSAAIIGIEPAKINQLEGVLIKLVAMRINFKPLIFRLTSRRLMSM